MNIERGKLFVVEGGVGCGKTTQLNLLAKELGEGWNYYSEPGGTVFGEMMRSAVQSRMSGGLEGKSYPVHPYAALFAYNAARANLLNLKVIPDLKAGINVGLDRYWYSTFSYQGAEGVFKPLIWAICLVASRNLKPEVVLHYDLLPEVGLKRKAESSQSDIDRYDEMNVWFHRKVRKNYYQLKLLFPEIWEVIDASKSIEEIKEDSIRALRKHGLCR
jgi:dTMP kinase